MLLDASAVLALINEEAHNADLETLVPEGDILSIAYAEVIGKLIARGHAEDHVRRVVDAFSLNILPLDAETAFRAGALRGLDKDLSLADRCQLAYAMTAGVTLLTGDRAWIAHAPGLGIRVELIR